MVIANGTKYDAKWETVYRTFLNEILDSMKAELGGS